MFFQALKQAETLNTQSMIFFISFFSEEVLTPLKKPVCCAHAFREACESPGNLTTEGATALQKAMRPARGKLTVNRIPRSP